jgi:acyl-CoA reductase-like NAD-dependent aldehyde dehydrogenase
MSTYTAVWSPIASGPGLVTAPPVSDRAALDAAVARTRAGAERWATLAIGERLALARAMLAGYARIADRSVQAACVAKGIPPGTPPEGEEWVTGPWSVLRHLRLVCEALESIARTGTTPLGPLSRSLDGRLSAGLFPGDRWDRILFGGVTAEVRFLPEMTEARVEETRASSYRHPARHGRTVLVLGAGNLASIPTMDVITKLFNEQKACVLKLSPVNAYLGRHVEDAFAEPIARGYLAIVYGGAAEGAYLAEHPGIDEIHLTGSEATYETLVWGPPGPERETRKARGEPALGKPVTAELGSVSPVLVVPGPYERRELAFQAEAIAGAVTTNASFVCTATKVVVSPRRWRGRRELLDGIERALGTTPPRTAFYPGAAERWQRFTRGRRDLRTVGQAGPGQLPWALLPGLDAENAGETAFRTEAFCAVLAETEVASEDPLEYLDRAVEFVNERLWGTLSATIVVHPKTIRDPRLADAVERAIGRLRYGTVAVNAWAGVSFALASPPWGAYPGSTPEDIQSGIGFVHNTAMLSGIEKVILRHPLTVRPKPVTFPSHRTAHRLGRRLAEMETAPSWRGVARVVGAAMRG